MENSTDSVDVQSILNTMYEHNPIYKEIIKIPNIGPHQILKLFLKFNKSSQKVLQVSEHGKSFTVATKDKISLYTEKSVSDLSNLITQASLISINSPTPPGIASKKKPSIDFAVTFTLRTSEPHYHTSFRSINCDRCLIHLLHSKQACVIDIYETYYNVYVYNDIELGFYLNDSFIFITTSGFIIYLDSTLIPTSLPLGYISEKLLRTTKEYYPDIDTRPLSEYVDIPCSSQIRSHIHQYKEMSQKPLLHDEIIQRICEIPEVHKWCNICSMNDDLVKAVTECLINTTRARSHLIRYLFKCESLSDQYYCEALISLINNLSDHDMKAMYVFFDFLVFGQKIQIYSTDGLMKYANIFRNFAQTRDCTIFDFNHNSIETQVYTHDKKSANPDYTLNSIAIEDIKTLRAFADNYLAILYRIEVINFNIKLLDDFVRIVTSIKTGDDTKLNTDDIRKCKLLEIMNTPSDPYVLPSYRQSTFSTLLTLDEEKTNTIGASVAESVFVAQLLEVRRRRLIELVQHASVYLMVNAPNPMKITVCRLFSGITKGNTEIDMTTHALGGDYNRMIWPAYYLGFHQSSSPDFTHRDLQEYIEEYIENLRKPIKRMTTVQRARMDHIRKLKGTVFVEQYAPLPVSYIGGLVSGLLINRKTRFNNSQLESFFKNLPIYDLPHESHWDEVMSQMVKLSADVVRASIIFSCAVTRNIVIDYKQHDPFFKIVATTSRIASMDFTSSVIEETFVQFSHHCKDPTKLDPFLIDCQLSIEAIFVSIGASLTDNDALRRSILNLTQNEPLPELISHVQIPIAHDTYWCKMTPKSASSLAFHVIPANVRTSIHLATMISHIGKNNTAEALFSSKFTYYSNYSLIDFFIQGCGAALCSEIDVNLELLKFNTIVPAIALYWKLGIILGWSLRYASLGHDVLKVLLSDNIYKLSKTFTTNFVHTNTTLTTDLLYANTTFDIGSLAFAHSYMILAYCILYSGTCEHDMNTLLSKANRIVRSDIVSYEDIVQNVATNSTQSTVIYTDFNTDPNRIAPFGRLYHMVVGKASVLLNLDNGSSCLSLGSLRSLLAILMYVLPIDRSSHESKFVQFVHSYIPSICKSSKIMSTNSKGSLIYIKNARKQTVSHRYLPLVMPEVLPRGFVITVRTNGGREVDLTEPVENLTLKKNKEISAWCQKPISQLYTGEMPEICLFMRSSSFVAGTDIAYNGSIADNEPDIPDDLLNI